MAPRKASIRKQNKYKVMRGIYNCYKTKTDLMNEWDMHPLHLKNALDDLLRNGDIEAVKGSIEKHGETITVEKYCLTDKGIQKLAYYDYVYALYKKLVPPYERNTRWHREYQEEIADVIYNSNFYRGK